MAAISGVKQELQRNSNIDWLCAMSGEPGDFYEYGFEAKGRQPEIGARTEFTDFEFVKILALQ